MKLSKEQAKVLDRQIRLFGFDLQKKLLQARVLVSPLNPTNVEFAKNIILTGLAVDFFDSELVSQKDTSEDFLLSAEDIGKKVQFLETFQMGPGLLWFREKMSSSHF